VREFLLRSFLAQLWAEVMRDFAEGSVTVYFEGPIIRLAGQVTFDLIPPTADSNIH
jgi:hypothetical protein